METGAIIHEKEYSSPRPPPKISFQNNWMKELGSEVAGDDEKLPTNPTKDHKSNERTGRPVESCVPVSVERLDKDKDADENVSEQSIGLFTNVRK